MKELCEAFPKMKKAFEQYKLSNYTQEKPLDYIMVLPRSVMVNLYDRTVEVYNEQKDARGEDWHNSSDNEDKAKMAHYLNHIKLENIFKNVAFKRFLTITQTRIDISIGEMVRMTLRKK